MLRSMVLCTILTVASSAVAGPDHSHPAPVMPKEFDQLKSLVGTWEGKSKMGETEQTVTVVYALTSGGTAISETLMAGTPHEMVTVYHKEGDTLAMTHYCALGNQPHMRLKSADGNKLSFELYKNTGIGNASEPHMHAVTLTLDGPNSLKQEWVHFAGGKPTETVTFQLSRKS